MGALFSPAYLFLLPSIDFQENLPLKQRLAEQVDWLGILFFAGTMTAFIMAITFGGSLYAWSSASEIVLWIMTGILFIVFVYTQAKHPFVTAQNKLYPTSFLRRPTLVMLQLLVFMAALSLLVGNPSSFG